MALVWEERNFLGESLEKCIRSNWGRSWCEALRHMSTSYREACASGVHVPYDLNDVSFCDWKTVPVYHVLSLSAIFVSTFWRSPAGFEFFQIFPNFRVRVFIENFLIIFHFVRSFPLSSMVVLVTTSPPCQRAVFVVKIEWNYVKNAPFQRSHILFKI